MNLFHDFRVLGEERTDSSHSIIGEIDILRVSWPHNEFWIEIKYEDISGEPFLLVLEKLWNLEEETSVLMWAVQDRCLLERSQFDAV